MCMGILKSRHQQITFYINLAFPCRLLHLKFCTDFCRIFALAHITDHISFYPEFSVDDIKSFLLI